MRQTISLRVTAPAGLRLPGLGSRQRGETFEVDPATAEQLDGVPGLERVALPPARKSRPADLPDPEVEETSDHAR